MAKNSKKNQINNKKETIFKRLAENRYAKFQYEIAETIEAGIELLGTEVKSIRDGKANLRDGYCSFRDGEILLLNVHISPHKNVGSYFNHDPLRNRKLLLNKKEIIKLKSNTEKKGMTIVPLSLYLKGSWIKVNIGVGKGKKLHDKRQTEKQKSINREINSALKR
ncbi:SsrA-binding protein SmpB [Prochlorococcus marinus]|uniref:SsrA-binding protein SmpB n=1 Tax=Prochlorococcus marinus TaxID=1219 RepID=UPI001ADA97D8|nr:SsrA-binding protein SmpB [Prochlorococcus marinus]MBO8218096.1 SsrA-binding protein SmpB [Prochlorococcus marinus XMU1405]MBW3039431.1 SsrA-binding protein [Prochlorococcus marinus str. MU1405]MBW3046887.1 SsrA-binding protein [Prochlorococcus marinus str. MU1406]